MMKPVKDIMGPYERLSLKVIWSFNSDMLFEFTLKLKLSFQTQSFLISLLRVVSLFVFSFGKFTLEPPDTNS